jgi:hypothetical protein
MKIVKRKNIDIQQRGGELTVTYRWRSQLAYFLLLFCVIWDLVVLVFLFVGAGWFIAIHLLVGFFMTWYMLGQMFNKTTITADGRQLQVVHGPVPTISKNRTIPTTDIRQLYLSEGGTLTVNGRTSQLWRLMLERTDDDKFSLMSGLADKDMAHDIERALEAHLDIDDEARSERMELPTFIKNLVPSATEERQIVQERRDFPSDSSPSSEPLSFDLPTTGGGHFALRKADRGDRFFYLQEACTVRRNERIDWEDTEQPTAPLITADGDTPRHFYTALLHDRWTYYEERPLDRQEAVALGFEPGVGRPPSLRNGDDRYYPGEPLRGKYADSGSTVEQVTFLTTRASTQFRALKEAGRDWQVYVQEPLDDSVFSTVG